MWSSWYAFCGRNGKGGKEAEWKVVGVKRKYGKEAQTRKREEMQKRRERLKKEYQLFSFGEHRTIQKNADSWG